MRKPSSWREALRITVGAGTSLVIGRVVFDTLLPHVQGARTAARLLAADAAVRAQDGDIDGRARFLPFDSRGGAIIR